MKPDYKNWMCADGERIYLCNGYPYSYDSRDLCNSGDLPA